MSVLLLAACSENSLEGKYQDKAGNTFEFIKGGTAVIISNGEEFILAWERVDDGRLKLVPGSDTTAKTQICNFRFENSTTLYLSGCDITKNVTLTRL